MGVLVSDWIIAAGCLLKDNTTGPILRVLLLHECNHNVYFLIDLTITGICWRREQDKSTTGRLHYRFYYGDRAVLLESAD